MHLFFVIKVIKIIKILNIIFGFILIYFNSYIISIILLFIHTIIKFFKT